MKKNIDTLKSRILGVIGCLIYNMAFIYTILAPLIKAMITTKTTKSIIVTFVAAVILFILTIFLNYLISVTCKISIISMVIILNVSITDIGMNISVLVLELLSLIFMLCVAYWNYDLISARYLDFKINEAIQLVEKIISISSKDINLSDRTIIRKRITNYERRSNNFKNDFFILIELESLIVFLINRTNKTLMLKDANSLTKSIKSINEAQLIFSKFQNLVVEYESKIRKG